MVESTTETVKQCAISYPCLMSSYSGDLIVLFSEEKKGMVMKGTSTHQTGVYYDNWAMDRFIVYNESITLKNV